MADIGLRANSNNGRRRNHPLPLKIKAGFHMLERTKEYAQRQIYINLGPKMAKTDNWNGINC